MRNLKIWIAILTAVLGLSLFMNYRFWAKNGALRVEISETKRESLESTNTLKNTIHLLTIAQEENLRWLRQLLERIPEQESRRTLLADQGNIQIFQNPNPSVITIILHARLSDGYEYYEGDGRAPFGIPKDERVRELLKDIYEVEGVARVSLDKYELYIFLGDLYRWDNVSEKVLKIIREKVPENGKVETSTGSA